MGNDGGKLNKAEKADLAYALSQLLKVGKVTPTEVDALLDARVARIKSLEAELQRLKSGGEVESRPQPYTTVLPPVLPVVPKSVVTHVLKHFDAKVAGRFYALVQHRVPSAAVRAEWLALARKIGAPAALKRFEKLGVVAAAKAFCDEPKTTVARHPVLRQMKAKLDAKTAGRFYALVQHRVPSAAKRDEWRALARKIGVEAALKRFEQDGRYNPKRTDKETALFHLYGGPKNIPWSKPKLPKPPVKVPLSNARREFLHQQGLYFGHIRHVTNPITRNYVKSIARKQGIPAAVKELLRLRGKAR